MAKEWIAVSQRLIPTEDNMWRTEGQREDLQQTLQYEEICELVAGDVEYIPTRRLCVENMQKLHRTRTNDR